MLVSPFEMQSDVDIYGDLPEFVVEDIDVDKLGVLTAAVRIPRPFPLQADWLLPWAAPIFFTGVPCSKIRIGLQDRTGICNLIYNYEGVVGGQDFQFPPDQATIEIDCQSAATPITTHSRFLALAKKYAGKFNPADKDDFWYFAKNLPKALQGDVPADPDNNVGLKNPLYGTDSFQSPRLVFRRTYLAPVLPNDLINGVGFIDNSIVGGVAGSGQQPPRLNGRDNWLKALLRGTYRGNAWQIMTEWWASSGGLGWNEDIYRRIG